MMSNTQYPITNSIMIIHPQQIELIVIAELLIFPVIPTFLKFDKISDKKTQNSIFKPQKIDRNKK